MKNIPSEREQAAAEPGFWRDFQQRWEQKYGAAAEPRILAAINLAQARPARAGRRLRLVKR